MEPRKINYISLPQQFSETREEISRELKKVFDSGMFILGPAVERFEKEFSKYLGVKNCIGVGSGTAALRLALWSLGIDRGDEVIVPANSFIATAGAVVEVGARPVFADVAEDMNLEPQEIERLANERTRAVIAVHLTGRPAKMDEITAVTKERKLFLIEDCAQAAGASIGGKKAGTLGDVGCFSFHPLKTLNCAGDGGCIVTNCDKLAAKLRVLRNHGLVNREHCEMWATNSRLDAVQAMILSVNLGYLEDWTKIRIRNADRYSEHLDDVVKVPIMEPETRSVYHTYVIQAKHRDELKAYLENCGIESKIHYSVPLHLQKAAGKQDKLPVCERLSKQILSLPVHQYLGFDEIDYVIETIRKFYKSY